MITVEIDDYTFDPGIWAKKNGINVVKLTYKSVPINVVVNERDGVKYIPGVRYRQVFHFDDEKDAVWFSLRWASGS